LEEKKVFLPPQKKFAQKLQKISSPDDQWVGHDMIFGDFDKFSPLKRESK
jgi:hypothetical protein